MYLEKLLVTLLAAPVIAPVPTTVAHQVVAQAPAQQAPAPAAAPKAEAPKTAEAPKAPEKKIAPEVKDLVDRMQAFYAKTQDFTADFKQDYKYKALRRTQSSTGTVIYKKPGLMRWEYEKPSKRTFVLAGEKVYAYDPEAQTLSVGRIDTSQLSASVTFLFGQGKLADEFSITKGECKDCKGTLLVLDPLKNEPRFRQVRLEVDPKTAQVLKSTVVDPDGSENAIAFLNLKTNVGIDADRFKINPPEGTRIDDFTKMRK
ncbi:outer membrane lipoprotein carrier protein LolA [Vitiosangium sp. GDMCC 1.1324]|uniref:LolA family protein n=1 Tax=Vitiosangium sp. (strain GDMCC 1.1324) TaxID=2138576 RepID=UPI000D372CD4|nr:outer membrane lipoprotein carrier protein LolA [Vitiosangium sp. GDMCC 1.1324]PTL79138.1 outer membrane lipoprotein carrier protein LolA [Vitiosangium sp. GDMCC 1.1324]